MISIFFKNTKYKRGQAILITVFFFAIISFVITAGATYSVAKEVRFVGNYFNSSNGYLFAEAGLEDIIYRLKNNMEHEASETIIDNTVTTVTTVTDVAPQQKEIISTATAAGTLRKIKIKVIAGVGTSFSYGVQTSGGGIELGGNAVINGNVYAALNILGSNGSKIVGTAISSNSKDLNIDQINDTPTTPPNDIIFNDGPTTEDFAQSFTVSTTSSINKVRLYIKKSGFPANLSVKIAANNLSGTGPETTSFGTGTLDSSQVGLSYDWEEVVFTSNPELFPDTTYWLVLDGNSGSAGNYYILAGNTNYSGAGSLGNFGNGVWQNTSPINLDGYFSLYLGGLTGFIDNVKIGISGVGDAKAHTVTNSTVQGSLYCQTGSGNNKSCNTSEVDPAYIPIPITEDNIDQWKNEATSGGVINGNYAPVGSSSTLGPKKIDGDLDVLNGHTFTITGTIWVTGRINISNNAIIELASGYGTNSGVIVTGSPLDISNNVSMQGSGVSGSYLMAVTTSRCPNDTGCSGANAIDVSNNVGAAVLVAPFGTLYLHNNITLKEATAAKVILDNNATITYETGLANVNFVSGPGGSWTVVSWKEI